MIPLPKRADAQHKTWLLTTLGALYDRPLLARYLYFKGGTCAAMQGFLSRFSVDLDFDYVGGEQEMPAVRFEMESVFAELGLVIADASQHAPQYFLKYPVATGSTRNTLKIDAVFPPSPANKYEAVLLPEVDRVITCQTRETMFAHKLVALIDRYEKREKVAGRDVFDIHAFFMNGFSYEEKILVEYGKCGKPVSFFSALERFVRKHVTQDVIDQDLNRLLPAEDFKRVRRTLKEQTLMLLNDEIRRLEAPGKTNPCRKTKTAKAPRRQAPRKHA